MKKLLLILAIAGLSVQGCDSGQAKNEEADKDSSNNMQDVTRVSLAGNTSGESVKLTKEVFLNEIWNYENSPREWVYKGDKPALIDFYADWCGPCKIASPILDEISEEYAGIINVYKIDTQVERELASVFGVKGIPAFLYIPMNGKPVMMSGIARTKEETKQMFKDNIDKYLLSSQ